ncbi:MAG: hypothetical protein JEZ01_12200 [Labilibaculum sp.]|nr:hypothetical protein [Labilibaculum sp.]MBI9058516.1 hypothetical protein [Labilibaculum sp.]
MENSLISILPGLLFLIPQIMILVACIMNMANDKSGPAVLMVIGSSIGLLMTIFHSIAIPILIQSFGTDLYSGSINVFTIATPINFIGSILFAIGLLLLIQEKTKAQQSA